MAQSILAYKLRKRFSLDMQFSQNHRANYGASFKALKVMLLPLKYQIFCFLSKFVLFTQASRKQIHISKIWLCHFLVYIAKHPHAKNEEHPLSRSWEKWVTDRQTDKQMDRWPGLMLQELFHKDGGLIMFYRNLRIKLSKIIWLDCEPYAMDQYKINAKDKD